ncbi:hypothetical protein [Actinoplanes sp. L3-i22]|uniref:hypothetical protein n=1 Tax=Actinoplanes sp. L3-i22 TaxID=2836373 RepID=UPI001C769A28|nr:hypothetical protein [Actinoplanes sp. L3-i22]BCY07334.1 hypothetical protein L3i22_024220 [Actinoplanes sp. L3-i22]
MYDGNKINAGWGNAWPTGNDVTNPEHEYSPVLQAPVANLLGHPWYLECGSPAGDYVTWLNLPGGSRVGISPHPAEDGCMRWAISINDENGNAIYAEHELLITTTPEDVASRVRAVMNEHGITQP